MICRIIPSLLLTLLCSLFWISPALAADDAAVKQALSKWQLVLQDIPGPEGIALAGERWRFVVADGEFEALGNREFLVSGVAGRKGEVVLSDAARQKLFAAWQQSPEGVWFVQGSHAYQLVITTTGPQADIELVRPEPEYVKEQRLTEEAAAKNRTIPLPASTYTQPGFEAAPYQQAFADWQQRFRADLAELDRLRNQPAQTEVLADPDTAEALAARKALFSHSIDGGTKGDYLKAEFVADRLHVRPATAEIVVLPNSVMFQRLVLGENTRPVGDGGEFTDDLGRTVQLWYVTFDEMSDWNLQDMKDSAVFSAFANPVLPAYRQTVRDSWPALVFVRNESGQLMLYAMSREMSAILERLFNLSIS